MKFEGHYQVTIKRGHPIYTVVCVGIVFCMNTEIDIIIVFCTSKHRVNTSYSLSVQTRCVPGRIVAIRMSDNLLTHISVSSNLSRSLQATRHANNLQHRTPHRTDHRYNFIVEPLHSQNEAFEFPKGIYVTDNGIPRGRTTEIRALTFHVGESLHVN